MGFQLAPLDLTLDDLNGSKIILILLDVKYVKNGKNYDVGPMDFYLDDLERLKVKVKVTNMTATAIGMWGCTPVRITGVLVVILSVLKSI